MHQNTRTCRNAVEQQRTPVASVTWKAAASLVIIATSGRTEILNQISFLSDLDI